MLLIDTDTLTLLFAGHDGVRRRLEATNEPVGTTIVNRIELLRGRFDALTKALDGQQALVAQLLLEVTEQDLLPIPILPFDESAAQTFDRLITTNSKIRRRVGLADLLIASIALSRRAVVVTRNTRDFSQVPNLRIENWAD